MPEEYQITNTSEQNSYRYAWTYHRLKVQGST